MAAATGNDNRAPLRLVVLISGSGTNLQAIIDAIEAGQLQAQIVAVISNRPAAAGLQRAARHGIHHQVIDHTQFADRTHFDQQLQVSIDAYQPDWIVLAGYMRLLSPAFVDHFRHRMLNIHPSLLPRYKGLNTHARALAAGDSEHGCSVHLVTPELDAGAIIAQRRVNIMPGDTVETLSERVQREEHRLYPQCLQWLAEGRLQIDSAGSLTLDGTALPATGIDLTGS